MHIAVRYASLGIALSIAAHSTLVAQKKPATQPDSSPASRLIAVELSVSLEVVDWGGTGRPIVLLAGLGNTAHVFEEFAPKLRTSFHVYGITRRGFGRSSTPVSGYASDRLGDDVVAVIDSLHLTKPILAGHSIAGEELSSVGSRHGDRVSALVYLEASDAYAFYDSTTGDTRVDMIELRSKLDTLRAMPSKPLIQDLVSRVLPTFDRDLRQLLAMDPGTPPPPPPAGVTIDRSSFAAFRASRGAAFGINVPVGELREQFEEMPDGSVGLPLQSAADAQMVRDGILGGFRKYLHVSVPVLAIIAHPEPPDNFPTAAARTAFIASDSAYRAKRAAVIMHASPFARVVEARGGSHYVFMSNEADVIREIKAFVASLPAGGRP